MDKVQHPTDHVIIKASTDSEWDNCSFAIIYLSAAWKQLLAKRSACLIPFKDDSSFFSHVYWDSHVDFFVNTGNDPDDPLLGEDLLEETEAWSFVEVREEELDRFSRPENKIRAFQLKLTQDGYGVFQAWGDHTGEKFYTESFLIENLLQ